MKMLSDLPDLIAVFPLPGALLLPRSRLPLHIFEPRYLAMLDHVLKTEQRLIGMVQPMAGPEGRDAGFHAIGCAGRVTAFSETEDGRYMITLTGISRFRFGDVVDGFSPFLRAMVDWGDFAADLGEAEKDPELDRDRLMRLLERYFASQELSTDWGSLEKAEDELLINSLAMLCPFDPEEKQALLEAPDLPNRRETLMALLEFALRGGSHDEVLQ